MSEFTPGPWRYWFEEGYVGEITSANGKLVAGFDTEPNEADARLIAAAPELLGACELIVSAFDALKQGSAARNEPLQINAARAAIAKATGEQQ